MSTRDQRDNVEQCCALVLHEIERGVVFLRNSHNLNDESREICQRTAEKLVQWTIAIKSLVVGMVNHCFNNYLFWLSGKLLMLKCKRILRKKRAAIYCYF